LRLRYVARKFNVYLIRNNATNRMTLEEKYPVSKNQLLGEILLERHLITREQLHKALAVQKKGNGYIGEVLVKLGYVEERDVVVALVVQCNLPYIAIDKYDIDKSIIQLVSKEMARKYHVVPLDRVGNVLSIVMADPLNVSIKAELQRNTNCNIAPFISTKSEIEKAIERWYGRES
jgi:type IV pilus assembly protein PilB